jgi:hypothetical protein
MWGRIHEFINSSELNDVACGGMTWNTLAVDWTEQSLAIDSSTLEAGAQGLIRVLASDGFNTASALSAATFTVQPHPPSVSINTPADGSVFIGDQQLFLDASVNDMQDGPLSGTNVQWSSDLVGAIGAGAIVNFDAKVLSEGYHTITVTATDNEGQTNSAETHILVLHFPPPELGFQVPRACHFSGRNIHPMERSPGRRITPITCCKVVPT